MKIDPNSDVDRSHEMVLCERGHVRLHTGEQTPASELGRESSAFQRFCRALDPNRTWILALVPDDADRPVFFRAREACRPIGIHIQAPVETAEAMRTTWNEYLSSKRFKSGGSEPDAPTSAAPGSEGGQR